jgi:uncharacterized protein YaaQ
MMSAQSLLLAIIQQLDADLAISTLVNAGLRVTHIGSTGGFPTGTWSADGQRHTVDGIGQAQVERAVNPKGAKRSVWTT